MYNPCHYHHIYKHIYYNIHYIDKGIKYKQETSQVLTCQNTAEYYYSVMYDYVLVFGGLRCQNNNKRSTCYEGSKICHCFKVGKKTKIVLFKEATGLQATLSQMKTVWQS